LARARPNVYETRLCIIICNSDFIEANVGVSLNIFRLWYMAYTKYGTQLPYTSQKHNFQALLVRKKNGLNIKLNPLARSQSSNA